MLPYTTKTSLLAAHAAGQKFEVIAASGTRYPVTAMRSNAGLTTVDVLTGGPLTFRSIRPDGTSAGNSYRMEKKKMTADVYPRVDFKSADAARGAIAAGIGLVFDQGGVMRPVTAARVDRWANTDCIAVELGAGGSASFKLDGSHLMFTSWFLRVTEQPKAEEPKLYMSPVAMGHPMPSPASKPTLDTLFIANPKPTAPPAPVETVLEAYFGGKQIHTLKTREYVVGIKHERNQNRLVVTLRDPETLKERETPRYNLDGTHKFQKERNLVIGALPPKTPEFEDKLVHITIYKHAYNGSLFVIREGEVMPNIRGYSNGTQVGATVITERVKK